MGAKLTCTGEIDIVEGVNDQATNQMTLHTNAGAAISNSNRLTSGFTPGTGSSKSTASSNSQLAFTGNVLTSDCDVNAPDQSKNAGCAISSNTSLTFGTDFNNAGGGVYATEWTSEFIKIWFFPRGSFPSDIASASPSPSQNWGPPASMFSGDFSMDDHFKNLSLVFDTTFCGDWAGNTWNSSTCASLAPTCEEYVSNFPAAFAEAYWAVNTLQVFQDDGSDGASNSTGAAGSKAIAAGIGSAAADGSFVKSAALAMLNNIEQDNIPGESLQSPGGWQPRRRGGANLGRRV